MMNDNENSSIDPQGQSTDPHPDRTWLAIAVNFGLVYLVATILVLVGISVFAR